MKVFKFLVKMFLAVVIPAYAIMVCYLIGISQTVRNQNALRLI